jgi:hypothetical protein
MQIKPLATLGHEEIAELARNAADNGQPLREANVFEPGTPQWTWFTQAWTHRHRELVEDAA